MKKLIKITEPPELKEGDVILPMGWKVREVRDERCQTVNVVYSNGTDSWPYNVELSDILSLEGVMVEREVEPMEFEATVVRCAPGFPAGFLCTARDFSLNDIGKRFKCVEIPEVIE